MLKIVLLRRFNHSLPILPPKNAREYPRTDDHRVAYGLGDKRIQYIEKYGTEEEKKELREFFAALDKLLKKKE